MAPQTDPYADRWDLVGRPGRYSLIYTEKGGSATVLKGLSVWLDGTEHDRRPEAIKGIIEHEAAVYKRIGVHPRILRCYGLEVVDARTRAQALRLERGKFTAPRELASVRDVILREEPPIMLIRLRMAAEFAQGLIRIHHSGVLWKALSTRNALLFGDGYRLKLCDFEGASLQDSNFRPTHKTYETHYKPPVKYWRRVGRCSRDVIDRADELYAFGSVVYEITEWKVPYDAESDDAVMLELRRGNLPPITPGNPAKEIINWLWRARTVAPEANWSLENWGEMAEAELEEIAEIELRALEKTSSTFHRQWARPLWEKGSTRYQVCR